MLAQNREGAKALPLCERGCSDAYPETRPSLADRQAVAALADDGTKIVEDFYQLVFAAPTVPDAADHCCGAPPLNR